MELRLDSLDSKEIAEFLQQHLEDMRAVSPPESIHALDVEGLRAPEITFWSVHQAGQLIGCGALKQIDSCHGEVKSMRVRASARGRGVGTLVLNHIVNTADSFHEAMVP